MRGIYTKKKAKKEPRKYLNLYRSAIRRGTLVDKYGTACGLCNAIQTRLGSYSANEFQDLMSPRGNDYVILLEESKSPTYWGSDSYHFLEGRMTPLRENLLLLMAAAKGELK